MTPVSDEAIGSLSAFHVRRMCTGCTRQVGQADVRTAARYAHLVDGHVIELYGFEGCGDVLNLCKLREGGPTGGDAFVRMGMPKPADDVCEIGRGSGGL